MLELKDFLIDENATALEAMELLNKVSKKVLFVLRDSKFAAAITDGDIRRWILKKGDLNVSIKHIANYNPKYLMENDKEKAKEFMKKNAIEGLPVLNEERDIVSIVLWNDEEFGIRRSLDVPVVIMAGGYGTRLYPYTKILPKPLIPIGEIPIVEHIINRFNNIGCREFYLIVNHKKNMIKAYFNETGKKYKIRYIDEDKPLGTGGGLSLLKGNINKTFILSNCDIIIEEDYFKIYSHHKKEENLITMVCSLKNLKIPYGVVEISDTGFMEDMKEKPELSFFVNTGVYIVEPEIINDLEENIQINFTDIIQKYKGEGKKIGIYPISEHNWMDMGELDQMEEMRRRLEQ